MFLSKVKPTLILLCTILYSCTGGYNNATIGNTYMFSCGNINMNTCYECDRNWYIYFEDNSSATIYSKPSSSSNVRSCVGSVDYSFNSEEGSVSFNYINSRAYSLCKDQFYGTWKFRSTGIFDKVGASNCSFYRAN